MWRGSRSNAVIGHCWSLAVGIATVEGNTPYLAHQSELILSTYIILHPQNPRKIGDVQIICMFRLSCQGKQDRISLTVSISFHRRRRKGSNRLVWFFAKLNRLSNIMLKVLQVINIFLVLRNTQTFISSHKIMATLDASIIEKIKMLGFLSKNWLCC